MQHDLWWRRDIGGRQEVNPQNWYIAMNIQFALNIARIWLISYFSQTNLASKTNRKCWTVWKCYLKETKVWREDHSFFSNHRVSIYANRVGGFLGAFVLISVSSSRILCCCSTTCGCCFVLAWLPCPIIISDSVLGEDLINCPMLHVDNQ